MTTAKSNNGGKDKQPDSAMAQALQKAIQTSKAAVGENTPENPNMEIPTLGGLKPTDLNLEPGGTDRTARASHRKDTTKAQHQESFPIPETRQGETTASVQRSGEAPVQPPSSKDSNSNPKRSSQSSQNALEERMNRMENMVKSLNEEVEAAVEAAEEARKTADAARMSADEARRALRSRNANAMPKWAKLAIQASTVATFVLTGAMYVSRRKARSQEDLERYNRLSNPDHNSVNH